jgi:hypothetical protein
MSVLADISTPVDISAGELSAALVAGIMESEIGARLSKSVITPQNSAYA